MIFFSVVLIGAVIFQLSLLLTTKPIFYSELFYYPWLVSKGLMPYRDFFDNHGFLLYYVLSPFVQVKSLLALNIFYIGLKLGILVLIFSILMRITKWVFW
jgi:hypothetical protein